MSGLWRAARPARIQVALSDLDDPSVSASLPSSSSSGRAGVLVNGLLRAAGAAPLVPALIEHMMEGGGAAIRPAHFFSYTRSGSWSGLAVSGWPSPGQAR